MTARASHRVSQRKSGERLRALQFHATPFSRFEFLARENRERFLTLRSNSTSRSAARQRAQPRSAFFSREVLRQPRLQFLDRPPQILDAFRPPADVLRLQIAQQIPRQRRRAPDPLQR